MQPRVFSRWIAGVLLLLANALVLNAQDAAQSGGASAPDGKLAAGDLQELVAPIALYPDVLISQILPAATFPTDIVEAARWIKAHPDLKGLDEQSWDLSVISVAHYPEVLNKMDQDLDWTNALGAAFLDQPDDVMQAIQDLRDQAQDAGVLKTTPQQTVVTEEDAIRIVPTEKETIYIPKYEPKVIFEEDDDDHDYTVAATATASALSFAAGVALGAWLDNDCDWHGGAVIACRPGYWGGYGYRGAVAAWDNDWYAARGPRRGVVAGEHGGAYVGPRGAAVWGENGHGAAWRRPTAVGGPAYTGRYSGYNNAVGNRRNVAAGNTVNVNRTNVNIDRGDRTAVRGGDRTAVRGGDRTNVAGGNRTNAAGSNRTNTAGGNRANTSGGGPANTSGASRSNAGASDRSANRTPAQPARSQTSGTRSSSFGDNRSASQVNRSSSRGASSRGGGGGGGRGGGGRR